uniref:Uncharacterized protein n=1 Tax=Anguilla anguilla TaxID=7936 RepID=A0A0E9WMD4_ANGAN
MKLAVVEELGKPRMTDVTCRASPTRQAACDKDQAACLGTEEKEEQLPLFH